MSPLLDLLAASVRDAYVQVSAFVAVTVLAFSVLQYWTRGALVERLESHRRYQPLVGACMGLTPGCGGAIVMMPLYVRGSVSFGTVVATLIATAGDSAFVILALAPRAGLYAYAIAFGSAIVSGYAIDRWGMGVGRVDRAVAYFSQTAADGGVGVVGPSGNPAHEYGACEVGERHSHPVLTPLSRVVHAVWWLAAGSALALGVLYLLRGAPDVPLVADASYAGLFTVVGVSGTLLSLYLYLVGRRYLGGRESGRETFGSVAGAATHAALETSFVTVWVVAAYLLYEYPVALLNIDVAAVAAAAGPLAAVAGAAVGLIPGCGPQIVLATAYAEGGLPFSALTANAISQDGDALFPLLAVDRTAAVVATVYTTIPGVLVGVTLYALFGPLFGFGVL